MMKRYIKLRLVQQQLLLLVLWSRDKHLAVIDRSAGERPAERRRTSTRQLPQQLRAQHTQTNTSYNCVRDSIGLEIMTAVAVEPYRLNSTTRARPDPRGPARTLSETRTEPTEFLGDPGREKVRSGPVGSV